MAVAVNRTKPRGRTTRIYQKTKYQVPQRLDQQGEDPARCGFRRAVARPAVMHNIVKGLGNLSESVIAGK